MRFVCVVSFLVVLVSPVFGDDSVDVVIPPGLRAASDMQSASRDVLFWFLCSSRDWRVTEVSGALTAEHRTPAIFLSGMSEDEGSAACSCSIRFSPYDRGAPAWLRSGAFTHAKSSAASVRLTLSRAKNQRTSSGQASRLLLSLGNDVWIEIYEASPQRARQATTNALASLSEIFSSIADGREGVERQLLDDRSMTLLPDQAHRESTHEIRVTKTAPAEYEMTGYVNPGERGFIEVLAQDRETGVTRNDAKRHRTLEWTGWSSDRQQVFYFDVPITVDGDGSQEQIQLLLQFTPRNSTVLLTTNCVVETWTR